MQSETPIRRFHDSVKKVIRLSESLDLPDDFKLAIAEMENQTEEIELFVDEFDSGIYIIKI